MSDAITLARAEKAIEAGKAKAVQLGTAFTVSIVDSGARLVALSRMDGAAPVAVEASQAKARTAVLFQQPTGALAPAVQPGAPLFGIGTAAREPLVFIAGGVPVIDQHGRVLGAIGVAGGMPDQDSAVAEAVLEAF